MDIFRVNYTNEYISALRAQIEVDLRQIREASGGGVLGDYELALRKLALRRVCPVFAKGDLVRVQELSGRKSLNGLCVFIDAALEEHRYRVQLVKGDRVLYIDVSANNLTKNFWDIPDEEFQDPPAAA